MAEKKGWINVHLITETKEIVASRHSYATKEEADTGIFIGAGVQKLGCFEVSWEEPDNKQ